jgi:DNA polymerase-3 subunit beta
MESNTGRNRVMKVTCSREALLTGAQLTSAAVAVREIKPILRNIKIVADSKSFTLMATDLELGIRHEMRGPQVEAEGEAMLPAARTTQILREATDADLVLEADESQVRVRGQVNKWDMPAENPADFPDIPTFDEGQYYEVAAGVLAGMIKRTSFAVAKESTKFAMTGVLWEVEGKNLRLVATDSKRLALAIGVALSHDAGETKGQSHLVPTKAMQLLERHLQMLPGDQMVQVCLRTNDTLFHTDTTTIYTRLVEGRYPPYREIFPKKTAARVTLPVVPFMTAVRQAAIMTDDDSRRVVFHFGKQLLKMEAQSPTSGRSEIPLTIDYDGPAIDINFDPGYLVDMLRVLQPDDPLMLELVDGSRPALFKCGPDYSYLVMPLS